MAAQRFDHQSPTTHRGGNVGTDVLVRLAAGDQAALLALYDGTADAVFGLVQAIVVDPADAEKITLDVYADIWRHATRLDPAGADPESCVLVLAHRHAVEHRRSRRAAAARDEAVRPSPATACTPSGLDALDAVPRELLLLTYYSGYTYRQAAALLGLSDAAAQVQLRTALRALARSGAQSGNAEDN